MTKRGKVLQGVNAGPGLLAIDGQNYQFSANGVWKGQSLPTPGMSVQVDFGADGSINSVIPVPESQIAKDQAGELAKAAGQQGQALAKAAVARFGLATLIATGLLIVGWFFLTAVSIQSPLGKIEFTFWQLLSLVNSGNAFATITTGVNGGSAGIYGLLAFVALAGPFLHYFWKDKRASLAGVLPLLFMAVVWIMVRSSMHSALGGGVEGPLAEMQRQATEEIMKAISIGIGMYLSAAVSLYFAAIATRQFLVGRAVQTQAPQKSSRMTA